MNELGTIARSLLKDGFTYSQVKEVLEHALRLKGLTDEQIERHLQFLSEQPCVLTAPPGEQSPEANLGGAERRSKANGPTAQRPMKPSYG